MRSITNEIVDWMLASGIPVTRENFIEVNWLGNPPEHWDAECEMQLPTFLQSSAEAFGADANWSEADHPRGQPNNAGEFGPGGAGAGGEHKQPGGEKAKAGPEHVEGGGGNGGGNEPQAQHQTAEPKNSTLPTGAPLPHDVIARIASAAKAAAAIPATIHINSPERDALRAKIADDLYSHDIGKRARDHEATIILGLPGAGKSTFANPLLNAGAIEIDPDLAKEKLPEFNHGLGAMATHEESSAITREVLKKALANGDNIVWPRINSPEKIVRDIQSLKAAGYNVHVRFVDVDHDVAIQSVINRYLATGRFVPASTIEAFGDKAAHAYEAARVCGLLDSAERHKRSGKGFEKVSDDE